MRKIVSIISALAIMATISMSANAVLLFEDNFDQDVIDAGGTVLNFNDLNNWTVDSGTIDLISDPNRFGIGCAGGTGGCVDIDGSTSNAGRLVSREVFSITIGTFYNFYIGHSGNQRGGADDNFLVQFLDATTLDVVAGTGFSDIASDQGFVGGGTGYDPQTTFLARLAIEGLGNDNVGAIIDNVRLCTDGDCAPDVVSVPEPSTFGLAFLGLIGLGMARRRNAKRS